MLSLLLGGMALPAFAQAPPPPAPPPGATAPVPPAPPPSSDPQIAALEARIAALEAQLQADEQAAFLREAEAAAAAAPPPPPQVGRSSANALNPGITAFGDLVGQVGVAGGDLMPGSTMFLRSLELELRADVDPFAKADAVIAWEQEAPDLAGGPGEGFGSEPEEAYVDLVALPWRLSARVGKFRQPFGIVNRMHPHDLPWVDVPELLGEEGYNDTGGTLQWLVPLGPAALTVTGGALSGEPFDEDGARAAIAGLGRAELFVAHGSLQVALGGSTVRDMGNGAAYVGADAMVRYAANPRRSVALLGEAVQDPDGGLAGYGAIQLQPGRNVYVGVREDVGEEGLKHNAFLTYYTSEFLRVRAGGGYAPETDQVDALAQLTFVWGSHPVEPWWVNR